MPQYILDTDSLTLLRQGNAALVERLQQIPPDEVAITVITVEEQLSGWYSLMRQVRQDVDLERAYERLAQTVRFLARLPVVGFSQLAIQIGKMDLRIAAITMENRAILVTRNTRDFERVPGLVIVDWTRTE